jgi:hypothetical protein
VGEIISEWGRDQIGTVGEIIPEWWATSSGISNVERGSGEPLVLLHGNGSMIRDLESSVWWSLLPTTPGSQAQLIKRAHT